MFSATPNVGIAERVQTLNISTTVGGAGQPALAPRPAYGYRKEANVYTVVPYVPD
jgi:hypothetical protein